MNHRVVFDTSTVVSALLFKNGKLAWLRKHWQEECVPLVSTQTAQELIRVLGYPKFRLSDSDRDELLGEYLPFCQVTEVTEQCESICRDKNDQMFLDLAVSGGASWLVTSDKDLLEVQVRLLNIEFPESYAVRMHLQRES